MVGQCLTKEVKRKCFVRLSLSLTELEKISTVIVYSRCNMYSKQEIR